MTAKEFLENKSVPPVIFEQDVIEWLDEYHVIKSNEAEKVYSNGYSIITKEQVMNELQNIKNFLEKRIDEKFEYLSNKLNTTI